MAVPLTLFRRAATGLAMAVALFAHGARADEPSPAEQGRKTYTSYCARCHGFNLVMVTGTFDLRTFPKDDKDRFVRSVSKGLRAMPAWEGSLKPEEIDAVWAYIGSVNGWSAAASK
jgi:mono/diheme cytochrome c family protein